MITNGFLWHFRWEFRCNEQNGQILEWDPLWNVDEFQFRQSSIIDEITSVDLEKIEKSQADDSSWLVQYTKIPFQRSKPASFEGNAHLKVIKSFFRLWMMKSSTHCWRKVSLEIEKSHYLWISLAFSMRIPVQWTEFHNLVSNVLLGAENCWLRH